MTELTPVSPRLSPPRPRRPGDTASSGARTGTESAALLPRRLEGWAVFVLGTAVSLVGAWHVSLWADEAATVSASDRSWPQLARLLGHIDTVHGLYYAVVKVWTGLVGTSETALRVPSALAVGATAVLVLLLGRRLTDPTTALVAAVGCALLPRLAWAGIEARPFALSALMASAATLGLLRALERPTAGRWAAYAGLCVVGVAANIYLVLLVVAHGVTVLLADRRRRTVLGFGAAAVLTAVVTSPLLLRVRSQQDQLGEGGDRGPLSLLRKVVVNQYFLGTTPSSDATARWFQLLWQLAGVGLALVAAVLVAGVVLRRRPDRSPDRDLLAVALPWVVLPSLAIAGYAVAVAPVYRAHYLTFTAPAVCLLVARGLLSVRPRRLRLVVAAALVLGVLVVDSSQRTTFAKSGSDWSVAASTVARLSGPGDAVYFVPRYPHEGTRDQATARRIAVAYPSSFAGLDDLTELRSGAASGTLDGYSRRITDVTARLAGHRAVWMVYGEQYPAEVVAEGRRVLVQAGFTETLRWTGPRTRVIEFVANGS